ncbi:MAG: GTPase-activating protein [Claussenomyces sp. TS43310]|nr:MAG: GTPase-activating protein [Claussenomyces sp. TS43310]
MSDHESNERHSEEGPDSNLDISEHDNDTFEDATDATPSDHPHAVSPPASTRTLTGQHRQSAPIQPSDDASDTLLEPEIDASTTHDHEGTEDTTRPKSPLLTSHRLSSTSMDNVNLEEETERHSTAPGAIPDVGKAKPALPARAPSGSRLTGLSGNLPSVPWSPPPPPPPVAHKTLPTPTAPPPRKLTGPFSWLSRNSSSAKEAVISPPLPPVTSPDMTDRRNTVSSIATIGSNPEMMLGKLEEGNESDTNGKHPTRNSLRDRFKLLRMREEGESTSEEEQAGTGAIAAMIGRGSSIGLGVGSPTSLDEQPATSPGSTSPNPATYNPSLAPGTAAGVAAGPSAFSESVDWDLWQAVVYEGPAAVARTSPEELNRAIAKGIPNAIRGVVWQVLAQSKNEELENVYKHLLTRGTDKDKDRMSGSSGATITSYASNGSTNATGKDPMSSSSSVHSDHSTLATTVTNGVRSPSPAHEKDAESIAKAQAAAMAGRKKKAKEDAAALLKLEKTIKRDLGARTSFSKFAASAGLQDGLFGVCKAYALFDEGVGYAQGMNFLAMPLLFNMAEEEAFCLLVRLMNQYHLRDLFIQDMPGLHMHLYQFERLLEDFEPALYCHLHRRQVTPHLYATQWFLTLFAYRFPLQLVLRIYDLILSEGLEAILKFGIILMQKNAATLLSMNDMSALTNFLKDRLFDVYIDQSPSVGSILESGFFGSSASSIDKEVYRADRLVQDACAVKITPEVLKTYATEWEEKTRAEAAREAEFEHLKSTNHNLLVKVRRLEERVEEHDTEHAALATELVRTKVENEELNDENESLKGQVQELRTVVERQPEEVEERLKEEMNRLMKRNQEVHEDNTRLEDEMAEMEKTLVETKMAYAQIREEHESMSQRLVNMRKALD